MPEYIGHDGTKDYWIFIAFLILLVPISIFVMSQEGEAVDKIKQEQGCAYYKDYKLSDVPASCITPEGGFKSEN